MVIGISHKGTLLGLVSWDTETHTHVAAQTFSTNRRTLYELYDSLFHYVSTRNGRGEVQCLALHSKGIPAYSHRLAGFFTAFAAEFRVELVELCQVDDQQVRATELLPEHHREPAVVDALAAALAAVSVEGKRGRRCR